jgi:hypothetical protein
VVAGFRVAQHLYGQSFPDSFGYRTMDQSAVKPGRFKAIILLATFEHLYVAFAARATLPPLALPGYSTKRAQKR